MSTQRLPRLAGAIAACGASYAQIPLLAGRAVPPLDQVTRFSRVDMCHTSRQLST